MKPLLAALSAILLIAGSAWAKVSDKSAEIAGMTVHYKIALPGNG